MRTTLLKSKYGVSHRLEENPAKKKIDPWAKQSRIHDCSVAGGWAVAVMIWAGAVMVWTGAFSNINFPTLKIPKSAKKSKL